MGGSFNQWNHIKPCSWFLSNGPQNPLINKFYSIPEYSRYISQNWNTSMLFIYCDCIVPSTVYLSLSLFLCPSYLYNVCVTTSPPGVVLRWTICWTFYTGIWFQGTRPLCASWWEACIWNFQVVLRVWWFSSKKTILVHNTNHRKLMNQWTLNYVDSPILASNKASVWHPAWRSLPWHDQWCWLIEESGIDTTPSSFGPSFWCVTLPIFWLHVMWDTWPGCSNPLWQ